MTYYCRTFFLVNGGCTTRPNELTVNLISFKNIIVAFDAALHYVDVHINNNYEKQKLRIYDKNEQQRQRHPQHIDIEILEIRFQNTWNELIMMYNEDDEMMSEKKQKQNES